MRPTYSQIMSTAAVFIALGGTGYAAAAIDGGDVRDGSLKGRDVRDRSLTGEDVRDGSLGPADLGAGELPRGPAGERGAQGERGPSDAITRSHAGFIGLPSHLGEVGDIDLPKGAWIVSVTGTLDNTQSSAANVACSLDADATSPAASTGTMALPATSSESFALTAGATLDRDQGVKLLCGAGAAQVNLSQVSMTAIRVATLTAPSA